MQNLADILALNGRALALAEAGTDAAWDELAEVFKQRHALIEAVFAEHFDEETKNAVREMAEAVAETDARIARLIEQKKQSLLREAGAIALGREAQRSYLANDGMDL